MTVRHQDGWSTPATDGNGGSSARSGTDLDEYLRGRRGAENFPVALRILPRALRDDLSIVYDVVRVIDDLGDQAPGDRVALLRQFRAQLAGVWTGAQPQAPVLRRLAGPVSRRGLRRQPFDDLIEANLLDQTVTRYPTYADLLDYCALSANPIGHLVLELFGVASDERRALSDRICTALQVIEHCQDVAEDRRAGRVYLPQEDLAAFGVGDAELTAPAASPAFRALIEFEARRAGALLDSGLPLLRQLHGWARLAVSGYAAGGRAAVRALRRGGWSVLPQHPPVRRRDLFVQLGAVLLHREVVV